MDPNIHQIINKRYRIIQPLGRGAFGTVYLAEDLGLQVKVVIKLTNEIESDDERRALSREARVLASVSDSHIVRFLDTGTTSEGHVFIVREYVEGDTLRQLIEQTGSLDLKFNRTESVKYPQ